MNAAPEQGRRTKKIAMQELPIPGGLREIENPGGGNCLFHAISQGLLQCAMKVVYNMIRAKVVTTMRIETAGLRDEVGRRPTTSHCRQLRHLRGGGAHRGWSMALEAAAKIFKVSVVVFTQGKAYFFNRNGTKGTIFLKFHARHWTDLHRRKLQQPRTCQL